MNNTSRLVFAALLFVAATTSPGLQAQVDSLRTFYFGNSLTVGSDPELHPRLAPEGVTWETGENFGAGWQLWQHRLVVEGGIELDKGDRGDLTIPASYQTKAALTRREFLENSWDAMLLQPFGQSLTNGPVTSIWNMELHKPLDVGDVENARYLIDTFLERNPDGKVYIYINWPQMVAGEPPEILPDWAIEMKNRTGRVRSAEFPDREAFDYEAEWLGKKYLPENNSQPWLANIRSQDYYYQLFEVLKKRYPQLWDSGRLVMIPVADIWLHLDRQMKAGKFPGGVRSITDFYTDVQHIRGGLPRYSVAAAFYAVMFQRNPNELNWQVYNDPSFYLPDNPHDAGEHFPLTAEQVAAINKAIIDVIRDHPYVHFR